MNLTLTELNYFVFSHIFKYFENIADLTVSSSHLWHVSNFISAATFASEGQAGPGEEQGERGKMTYGGNCWVISDANP